MKVYRDIDPEDFEFWAGARIEAIFYPDEEEE
jgi:hypothetical protein